MPNHAVPDSFSKFLYVAGIDEAGRGPLAGPVTAAAVVLPSGYSHNEINDSKQLSEKKREALYDEIRTVAVAYSVVSVGPRRIEALNIREATKLAMRLCARRIITQLGGASVYFLVDGNMAIGSDFENEPIIKGDEKVLAIAAASILAKVTRDSLMQSLHQIFPSYGFGIHKGYPTKLHRDKIRELGPTRFHRRTFAGVKQEVFAF